MRLKGILVTIIVVLVLIFTVLNWPSLSAPLPMNLFFFRTQAPMGLILVATILLVSFLFLLLSLFRRAGQLRQITHLERELEKERSRNEKRRLEELERLETRVSEQFAALERRLGETESGVRSSVSEHFDRLEAHERAQAERLEERVLLVRNELAADIAQIETSIQRSLPGSTGRTEVEDVVIVEPESERS
jgi:uncharacterized integral membrane protein